MKENKKKIFIGIAIVLIIIIITIIFVVLKKDKVKDKPKEEPKDKEIVTGISKNITIANASFIDVSDNYLIMIKNNKIVLNNLITNDEINTDYDSLVENFENGLLLFKKENKYILTDSKGKQIDTSSKNNYNVLTDSYTNKVYYTKANTLYDSKGNKLLDNKNMPDVFDIVNNLLLINDSHKYYFININNNKSLSGRDCYIFDDYLIVELKDKYWGYDFKTNIGKYYNKFKELPRGYKLSNDKEIIYFSYDNKVNSEDDLNKITLNDKYYIKYSNNCGKLISTADNSELTKECFNNHLESEYNKDLFILNNGRYTKYVVFPNGTIKEFEFSVLDVKNYLTGSEQVYDMEANEVETECTSVLDQIGNNNYYCDNGAYYNLLDNKLNIINKYEEIDCNGEYCRIKKDNKYGLLYKDKELISSTYNTYNDIKLYDNYIIINDIYDFHVFVIDKINDLSIEELKIAEYNYDIDINSIISEYKLQDIEDIINDNKELFKKYAYIVTHNKNLNGYDKKVFDVFKIVVDNKQYLNENYFLYKLSKLKIDVVDKLNPGVVGQYQDDNTQIYLLRGYKDNETVYYHELIHFLDHSFDIDKAAYYSKEENKYLILEEIDKFDKEKRLEIIYSEFDTETKNSLITEAGAEYYMAEYFQKGKTRTYYYPCRVFAVLENLFGSEKIKEIFYSKNGLYLLRNLLLEGGLTAKEIENFYELSNEVTYADDFNAGNIIKVADILVKVYNNTHKEKWTSDKDFSISMASLVYSSFDYPGVTSKNQKDYQNAYNAFGNHIMHNIIQFIGINTYSNPYCYKEDDRTYIIFDNYEVEYDLINDKVLGYEKI